MASSFFGQRCGFLSRSIFLDALGSDYRSLWSGVYFCFFGLSLMATHQARLRDHRVASAGSAASSDACPMGS